MFQPSSDLTAGCDAFVKCNPEPTGGRGFNPHPTSQPDATRCISPSMGAKTFQPSSDLTAGCDVSKIDAILLNKRFNPHPTSQPDAT